MLRFVSACPMVSVYCFFKYVFPFCLKGTGYKKSLKEELEMSHHLDTPLASQNGQLYIDDLYVFSGNRSTVFVMNVNSTITGPDVQRGFHPEARYEFKVHFDRADFEDLTYR